MRTGWILPKRELPPDGEEVLVLTQSKKGIRNIDKVLDNRPLYTPGHGAGYRVDETAGYVPNRGGAK